MKTPLALARSNRGTVDLPGVNGVDLSWRDNVPLYSAVGIRATALTNLELSPFSYAIGSTISNNFSSPAASSVTATNWHTNMRIARQLPAPEVFVADRLRVVIPSTTLAPGTAGGEIYVDSVAGATGASGLNSANALDLVYLQTLTLRLEIESKIYAEAPLYMFPANVGIGGTANHALGKKLSASNNEVNMRQVVSMHWAGEGWRFADSMPPVLTSSTVLDCRIRYEHPGTGPSITTDRIIWTVLQGRHGRAVR